MGGVAKAVSKAVSGVAKAAGKVVETVAENPVVAVAAVAVVGPAALPAALPAPVSAAAISAASTAIAGGDLGDIVKAGAAGALGNVVGTAVGTSVGQSFGDVAGKIASSAASSGTSALVATGDPSLALKAGLAGGLIQGGMIAAEPLIKSVSESISEIGRGMGETTQTAATGQPTTAFIPTSPFGTTEAVTATSPFGTTGTVNLPTITPDFVGASIPTSPFGTSEKITATSPFDTTGTVSQPSLSYPSMSYSPALLEMVSEPAGKAAKVALGEATQSGLQSGVENLLFSPADTTGITAQSTGPSPTALGSPITGEATGVDGAAASALAQALRVGDPGAPLFGTEESGQQRPVWNVASLKFKDETGG